MKTGSNFKFLHFFAALTITLVVASSCSDTMFYPTVRGNGILSSMEMEPGEFTAINHGVPGKLFLSEGDTPSLVIEADENIIPLIEISVIRKTLHLKTKENLSPGRNGLNIYVSTPSITDLSVNGSGSIVGEDIFQTGQLSLNINGSGNIFMEVETDKLNSRINGSGGIELKGYGEIHNININGSGNVKGYGFESLECSIKVTGSGNSYVNVAEVLDVHIMGSGDVYVMGSPIINARTSGSGRIINTGR
jgi:hypothetical protein